MPGLSPRWCPDRARPGARRQPQDQTISPSRSTKRPEPLTTLDAEVTASAVVSDLRRATGRFPHDPRLAGLIKELTDGNARFAELWAQGTVSAHREDHKIVEHPAVGPITVDCDVLTDGDADLKIVMLTAAPGTDDETKLKLAAIAPVP